MPFRRLPGARTPFVKSRTRSLRSTGPLRTILPQTSNSRAVSPPHETGNPQTARHRGYMGSPSTAPGDGATADRFAIVATAGHIDHGKTALVRRLTGVDTDRLPEEKSRGISIDLGFASLPLPSGLLLGIVDVPGHERFIKNMLAGVGGIDVVVLVIAADEGVMPQTREHLDIVTLLGVERGVVALTKSDLVDAEWLAMMQEDVRTALRGSALAAAPILPVSSTTGAGVPALLAAIEAAAREAAPRSLTAPARLPVDRAFIVEGFGTVVTGTLWRGVLRVGDTVDVQPGDRAARVRSLEVHGRSVPEARAGQRTAVALHGLARDEVQRGDWVTAPGSVHGSRLLDARLRLLPGAPALKSGTRVRVYIGASEVLGRIVFLEAPPPPRAAAQSRGRVAAAGSRLAPGSTALVQLRLEEPIAADRGDLFVARSYSPLVTLGGGTVLDPAPERHRGKDAALVERLHIAETGSPADRLLDALRAAGATPVAPDALARTLGATRPETDALLAEVIAAGQARKLGANVVHAEALAAAGLRLLDTLRDYQRQFRLRWGMAKGEAKSRLAREMSPAVFDAVLAEALGGGAVRQREDRLRAGDDALELTPRDTALLEAVRAALRATPFAPPGAADVATQAAETAQGSAEDARELLAYLTFTGEATRITSEFTYATTALTDIGARIRAHFATREELVVGDFKDLLGISRKHAMPLLEHLDRAGLTARRGDVRVAGRALTAATATPGDTSA